VRKAYRQAAKRNHPDKGGDAETFKKINEAWQVRARVWARVRRGVAGAG
jgi:curved DNA-binding protein CbpA